MEGRTHGSGREGAVELERRLVATVAHVTRRALGPSEAVDTLTEMSEHTVELLDVAAAGVLVRAGDGRLRIAGTSDLSPSLLGVLQAQATDGVAHRSLAEGAPLAAPVAEAVAGRAQLSDLLAVRGDVAAVHAFPMRVAGSGVGALSLLAGSSLPPEAARAAGLLADLATLVVLQGDAGVAEAAERTRRILDDRAVLAQAVGIVAERFALSPDEALIRLRTTEPALGTVALARRIVERDGPLPPDLLGARPQP